MLECLMSRLSFPVGLICLSWGLVFPSQAHAEMSVGGAVIDECQYATDAAAQAAWRPMGGTANVAVAVRDGRKVLRLPCNFAGNNIERASWDQTVKLDLASSRGVQFDVLCRDVSPVSYFSIYFQSGEGWYHASFFPESSTDWSTIEIDKAEMNPEGKPAGWSQIKTIRISAWRGKEANTEFFLRDLRQTAMPPPATPQNLAEAAIARWQACQLQELRGGDQPDRPAQSPGRAGGESSG